MSGIVNSVQARKYLVAHGYHGVEIPVEGGRASGNRIAFLRNTGDGRWIAAGTSEHWIEEKGGGCCEPYEGVDVRYCPQCVVGINGTVTWERTNFALDTLLAELTAALPMSDRQPELILVGA
uniref:Uncharacterized protein n=1 Tax=uncultured marine group II/III euryarchaeote KM3_83_G03 TaxID=1456522 RepID=A0A075HQJ5_9EURY|nr:hypothetical protein [uncultured marine group II/III euryarchaeote KM3_83_G03]